jgi:hypothetical protein
MSVLLIVAPLPALAIASPNSRGLLIWRFSISQMLTASLKDRPLVEDRFSMGLVLDVVSQVRNVVLMNVYLDLGNSGGSGFWNGGYISQGREMGS